MTTSLAKGDVADKVHHLKTAKDAIPGMYAAGE